MSYERCPSAETACLALLDAADAIPLNHDVVGVRLWRFKTESGGFGWSLSVRYTVGITANPDTIERRRSLILAAYGDALNEEEELPDAEEAQS